MKYTNCILISIIVICITIISTTIIQVEKIKDLAYIKNGYTKGSIMGEDMAHWIKK